jgi:hypothetical protein
MFHRLQKYNPIKFKVGARSGSSQMTALLTSAIANSLFNKNQVWNVQVTRLINLC